MTLTLEQTMERLHCKRSRVFDLLAQADCAPPNVSAGRSQHSTEERR